MKHKPHTQITEQLERVAVTLREVTREVCVDKRRQLRVARGVALLAQAARFTPSRFDNENGRDALSALAQSEPLTALLKRAESNAQTLTSRWSKVVYVTGLDLLNDCTDTHTGWRCL